MALQHLRSNTASKRPTPASMADGQLAINTNATSPGLFFKDAGGALIKVGPVHVGTSAPNSSPAGSSGNAIGEQWLDTSGGGYVLKIWDGSAWRSEAGEFVDAAGDTMTGALILPSGTPEAPALGVGSTNNGFYAPINQLAIATNGVGRVFIDNGGKVGIGAPSTSATLYVDGTVVSDTITTTGNLQIARSSIAKTLISDAGSYFTNDLSAGSFIPTGSGAPTNGMYLPSANSVAISTNGSGRLFVDSSGNVGVGIATPTAGRKLHVSGVGTLAQFDSSNASTLFKFTNSTASGGFLGYESDNLTFYTNSTERLRITSDGKLGLGTSSPSNTLHVVGTGRFNVAGSNNAVIASDGGDPFFYTEQAAGLKFGTNSAVRMTINSSGSVGVGTTSPSTLLTLAGSNDASTNNNTLRFVDTDTSSSGTQESGRIEFFTSDSTQSGVHSYIAGQTVDTNGNGAITFGTGLAGSATERARIDSSGRLGLGTSSPSTLLTLSEDQGTTLTLRRNNSAAVADDLIGKIDFFNNDGSSPGARVTATVGAYAQGTAGGTYLAFSTATNGGSNAERLRIDSSGNVGIGTTSPGRELEVYKDDSQAAIAITASTTGQSSLYFADTADSNIGAIIYTHSNNALAFRVNDGERARIDSSGRLLVGTSSSIAAPDAAGSSRDGSFQLAGNLLATTLQNNHFFNVSATGPCYQFTKSNTSTIGNHTVVALNNRLGTFQWSGSDGTAYIPAAQIYAQVDGTPGANDMPGRLVFSTTADGASSPTERMRINNGGSVLFSTDTEASITSATANGHMWRESGQSWASSRNLTSGASHFVFYNPNGVVGNIETSGSSTTYATSSDYRLKENVVPLTGAADRLNQLQAHRFNFIADPDTTVDGFIAHEAQAVVPECVTGTKDEVDDEGNPVYQGIDQSKLVPLLTAALQEAIGRIESLETEVAALKAS